MRSRSCAVVVALSLSLPFLFPAQAVRVQLPDANIPTEPLSPTSLPAAIFVKRDEHHHDHHAAPLAELNETEVTLYHAPTPPSYYTLDWDHADPSVGPHPSLMITHGLFMGLAFFVALPLGIILRSVQSSWHGLTIAAFYGFFALGVATSAVYRKVMPNMYEGAKHGSHGYLVLLLAMFLSLWDTLAFLHRVILFLRSPQRFSIKAFWRQVVLKREEEFSGSGPEYEGLVDEPEEFEESKIDLISPHIHHPQRRPSHASRTPTIRVDTSNWSNHAHHERRDSTQSEGTLYSPQSPNTRSETKRNPILRFGGVLFAILERSLVFAGFGLVLTGIVTYTGGCRGNYLNGCLAHLIKGSIFWCYGLLSFGRFLGSFAELGWAWNKTPSKRALSAEFVESLVIFTYGATNMWMERFGANAGDPFTTKQIQHISIAVMFCFAGLLGMGIESKMVRRWLASSTIASSPVSEDAVVEPPSYSASFNPFPALVIGVTGAAMAAHAQTYLFQVQIHALWGNLLVAFAVLRCFTYFFLWLGPPKSFLPSRPPTEALGSFFLTCGGLVFMFSTEELTIAAMRRGRDDVMMFLNVAVAITCLACCWTLFVVGFKGWIRARNHPSMRFRVSA